jgi:hypothetical protein
MLNGWRMERFKLVGLLSPFLHKMRSGDLIPMAVFHVRRDKAARFQRVQAPPGDRSSRKRPEQAWR